MASASRALLRRIWCRAHNGGAVRLPFDAEMAAVVEDARPAVVSFHFGLPCDTLLDRVKAIGAVIIGNATTTQEARWLEERGVDAIIAQGFEAGGHSGRFLGSDPAEALGLFALVPQIADAVSVPVIAAGGIADGRGIAAALTLGASAVQLGTAYLHAPEARVSEVHRDRLRKGTTVFTNLMTGGLARGLRGRLIDDLGPVRAEAPPYPLASAALAAIRTAAEKRSDFGFGPMWAGQAAPLGESLPAKSSLASLPPMRWRSSPVANRSARMEIVPVPAFTDNYIWLVHDPESGETAVVDPGVAAPVLAEAERRGWTIGQVWNTHWHPDHTGGNLAIKEATGARISGPSSEAIPGREVAICRGRPGRHRQARRPSDRGARPHLGTYCIDLRRGAGRICRRHAVRDGMRPIVRRNSGPDVRLPPEAGRAAAGYPSLLRSRIYACERPLCSPHRAGQRGDQGSAR